MKTHRFILEPHKGKTTRHNCPYCKEKGSFSRYIDTDKTIEFPDHVGRCNRENNCGYHITPKQTFEQNQEKAELIHDFSPRSQTVRQQKSKPVSFIDESIVSRSLTQYYQNKQFWVTNKNTAYFAPDSHFTLKQVWYSIFLNPASFSIWVSFLGSKPK